MDSARRRPCERRLISSMPLFYLFVILLGLTGCSYHLGNPEKAVPGGYRQLAVPIFRNLTTEPGIEVPFTNALINEFARGRVARVVDPSRAEAVVEGTITNLSYISSGDTTSQSKPKEVVLRTNYLILMTVKVTLKRLSDKKVLWTSNFSGQKTYTAPQVTLAGINTVNPIYNLSARRQNIDLMANDMMIEAHERLSENF
jgi:hypothetical protein